MNTPKWIPKHSADVLILFSDARQLERELRVLGKKFATNVNLNMPDYYEFGQLLGQSRARFEHSERLQAQLAKLAAISADQRIERSPYKVLQSRRATLCRQNLKRRHCQLIFVIQKMIRQMLGSGSDAAVDGALVLCTLHNGSVQATRTNTVTKVSGAQVCSNSFPGLMLAPRKFDLLRILQTIAKQRSELCCLALITCLLTTCAPEMGAGKRGSGGADDISDTSSVEILKALTVHLASPATGRTKSGNRGLMTAGMPNAPPSSGFPKQGFVSNDAEYDPTIDFFDTHVTAGLSDPSTSTAAVGGVIADDGTELLELVANEENYVANILLKCLKLCPSAFDGQQPSKADIIKWVNRGTRALWTQVGSTLEHVVLWWSHAPLACRPVQCARHLRDWLMQSAEAPEPVLSTLRGLGETLTVYVAGTVWDRQFRLTLVASCLPVHHPYPIGSEFYSGDAQLKGTTTAGRLWSELLHGLTSICNSCDRSGTIANELPIVEQIPVLHRLDHSIHTMRLWAIAQATALCSDWNMSTFFRVVHTDINQCLEQLKLRVPDLVPSDATEVLVHVCVALRAKLVSEIKVNIAKLKQTNGECIEVLATICRTTSLATLSLCFPSPAEWQGMELQERANDYVRYYMNELYRPVVCATQVLDILHLILKIMCEAWLDHIYVKRIKFSRIGAQNLMCDFEGVAEWIEACDDVLPAHRYLLGKHEVLRMCEGVAKILLRKPDDVISMMQVQQQPPPNQQQKRQRQLKDESSENDEAAQLPPEMFVPNQQRWLELRARNRNAIRCLICSCVAASSSSFE